MIFILIVVVLLIGGGVWAWPLLAGVLGLSGAIDKPNALQHIRQLMVTHDINPLEVEAAFLAPPIADQNANSRSKGDVAKTLFSYLGAIFILAGIGTYIGTFWVSMGGVMRVLVTLGIGYILLIVLISALYEGKYPRAILPITLASVFMLFSGYGVLICELYPDLANWRAATLFVFGSMALHWGVVFGKYQRPLFAFIALFCIYGFMHVGLDILGVSIANIAVLLGASLFLVGTALEKSPQRILATPALLIGAFWLNGGLYDIVARVIAPNWASLIIGLCLMLTAHGLYKSDRYPRLVLLAYFIGSVMFYAGLFDLVEGTSFELLFLALTAAILYLSVVVQSKALLLTTVLAMLSYLGYFSAEHFADSLGWPITLVLMGVIFMGISTIAIRLKRRI